MEDKNKLFLIKIILGVSIVVIIAIAVYVFVFANKGLGKFTKLYENNNYTEAMTCYNRSSDESKAEIEEYLLLEASSIEQAFIDDEIFYHEYESKLNHISDILPENKNIEESKEKIFVINKNREIFITGKGKYENGEYLNAISNLSLLTEDFEKYEEAQTIMTDSLEKVKDDIAATFEEYTKSNKSDEGIEYIENLKEFLSEEQYNDYILQLSTLKSEQANKNLRVYKLNVLKDQLNSIKNTSNLVFAQLYVDEEKGKYGLLTMCSGEELPVWKYYLIQSASDFTSNLTTYSDIELDFYARYHVDLCKPSGNYISISSGTKDGEGVLYKFADEISVMTSYESSYDKDEFDVPLFYSVNGKDVTRQEYKKEMAKQDESDVCLYEESDLPNNFNNPFLQESVTSTVNKLDALINQ